MSKIKVMQFPIANSNGGLTQYAINNWNNIDKDRFDCDFVTLSKKIDFSDSILASGAGLKFVSCYAEENEEKFSEEVRSILKSGYDVVHLHTSFWKSFLVEKIAKECNISKIIVHSHSTMVDINDGKERIEAEKIHEKRKKEFSTSYATDFCACSKLAADWLFGKQISRDKIKIMKNAINVEKYLFNNELRNKYRSELGLDGCFVIGNIGRLSMQKNHEFLLNVFADVCKKTDNAKLLIVGEGELRNEIISQAKELGIYEKIILAGFRNDVDGILQAMDVFCLPSRFEGLGIVLVEALSSGLKCMTSEYIPDEIMICDNIERLPFDISKWSDRICEFSKGYERENIYDTITDAGYNIRHQIKEVEKIYLG